MTYSSLGKTFACPALEFDQLENVVDTFTGVQHEDLNNIPQLSENQLSRTSESLQGRKALCPGGIPAEVNNPVAHACLQLLLNMYND